MLSSNYFKIDKSKVYLHFKQWLHIWEDQLFKL